MSDTRKPEADMDVARQGQREHGNDNTYGGPDPASENIEEDTLRYPTGFKLISIGVGLCLGVICSNLVNNLI